MDKAFNYIIFSDLHLGLKSDNHARLQLCENVVCQIIDCVIKNSVKKVFFLGDLFHSRPSLNVNTLNVAIDLISQIAKEAEIYLVLGNHDIHYKNSIDVNSIKIFKDNPNIRVISKPTEIYLNGKRTLLVPWLSNLSEYEEESFDMLFGHFNISSKYLISSYIEEHAGPVETDNIKVNEIVSALIQDESYHEEGEASTLVQDISSVIESKDKSVKFIGNFVNLVKKNGKIYSGHIHKHKEFKVKGRDFIFVGSPNQHTFGDMGNVHGFYCIKDEISKFVESVNMPKHIKIKTSECLNGKLFDFSVCRNNIVCLVVDSVINQIEASQLLAKIDAHSPFEIAPTEYQFALTFNIGTDLETKLQIGEVASSKIDYISNYIDQIDKRELQEKNIDPKMLYNTLLNYYKQAENNKE